MAAYLSNHDSFLHPLEPFCPPVAEQVAICSRGSDTCLSSGSPLTPSEALASSDEDDDYLTELTRQMANDMLREKSDEGRYKPGSVPAALSNRDMRRWVDLFAVSSQSTIRSPSGLSDYDKKADENSGAEGDSSWENQPAEEPRVAEISSDEMERVQTMSCQDRNRLSHELNLGFQNFLKDGNWRKEQWNIRTERAPRKQAKGRRGGVVQGEYYVGLSLQKPQKEGVSEVIVGEPNSRTGTGVFLPKTTRNQTEQQEGRKPRCSTVLIPARVAQALIVHFINMRQSSVGPKPNFQQKNQADQEPEPDINCNEMGLPQEWMY